MVVPMQYDITIIGGGIVGLATALHLVQESKAQLGLRVLVLEKEIELAAHQTGHNSGVIHSGIYYAPGSLKAQNCTEGYARLLAFCDRHDVPYRLCGKVIVATEEWELPALERIYERGLANGLSRIKKIGPERLKEIEPHAAGIAAIEVPYAGIVDYRAVSEVYARLIRAAGGVIETGAQVVGLGQLAGDAAVGSGTRVFARLRNNDGSSARETEFTTRLVINCAGLHCDTVAGFPNTARAKGGANRIDFRIIPFRGEYYELRPERRDLVRTLIYPVPDPAFPFLGVHFTNLIGGGVEAGPNAVLALKKEGYSWGDVSLRDTLRTFAWPGFRTVARKYWRTGLGEIHRSLSKAAFTRAMQRLVPEIQSDDLLPGGSGVRAQACARTGGLIDDFYFHEDTTAIHVGNAPSPAATSSLAIGARIALRARERMTG